MERTSSYPPDGFVGFMSPPQNESDCSRLSYGRYTDISGIEVTPDSLPDYVDKIISNYNTNEVKAIVYSNDSSDTIMLLKYDLDGLFQLTFAVGEMPGWPAMQIQASNGSAYAFPDTKIEA